MTGHVCKFFASPIHSFTTHGSSLVFHRYPRLEGLLLVTLFSSFYWINWQGGAYMHHCMMAFRRQCTCANVFAILIYPFYYPWKVRFLLGLYGFFMFVAVWLSSVLKFIRACVNFVLQYGYLFENSWVSFGSTCSGFHMNLLIPGGYMDLFAIFALWGGVSMLLLTLFGYYTVEPSPGC